MNLVLHSSILVILCFVGAHAQLSCNVCKESRTGGGDCNTEVKCKDTETRCLAIRWGTSNQVGKQGNTFDTRCATEDECSDHGRRGICAGQDCEAKCCSNSKCNPFSRGQENIVRADDRSFLCYKCSRESLDSCTSSEQKCDDDQDACVSFLMEGGNHDKVYTKRCARKDECVPSELDRLCKEEKDQSNRKDCRASCCYDEMCNEANLKTIPLLMITGAVLLALFILN